MLYVFILDFKKILGTLLKKEAKMRTETILVWSNNALIDGDEAGNGLIFNLNPKGIVLFIKSKCKTNRSNPGCNYNTHHSGRGNWEKGVLQNFPQWTLRLGRPSCKNGAWEKKGVQVGLRSLLGSYRCTWMSILIVWWPLFHLFCLFVSLDGLIILFLNSPGHFILFEVWAWCWDRCCFWLEPFGDPHSLDNCIRTVSRLMWGYTLILIMENRKLNILHLIGSVILMKSPALSPMGHENIRNPVKSSREVGVSNPKYTNEDCFTQINH